MKKKIILIGLGILIIAGVVFIFNIDTKPKALVAFVIDDWGYNRRNMELLFQIQRPLTVSILPNLPYSKDISEAVIKNSGMHEVILHLPLESKSNRAVEVNTIRCDMKRDEIVSILENDIQSIHGVIGVSNHQGSKATADERVMRIILNELKEKDLFFLDSVTTSRSVCGDVASDIGLRYVQRDVFLDLTDQTDLADFESYIRKQIRELADAALEKGSAVGIGHNKAVTLRVIKELIPELEEQGIKIVPLKELVE